ncbi:MAG: APC family permease [Bacteroidota bacterium]
MSQDPTEVSLPRSLRLFDLVLLTVISVVNVSSIANSAQFGMGSLLLWLVALLLFLLPSSLSVIELNSRIPGEGGIYLWTREALGDGHAFVVGWCYWLCNIVWFPTMLITVATFFLYIGGDTWMGIQDEPFYQAVFCLGLLWGVSLLNIIGLERAKWIQNLGGISLIIILLALFGLGGFYLWQFGPSQSLEAASFWPDWSDFSLWPYFALITFSFGGMELTPIMAGESHNPRRMIPRSTFLSALIVGLLYLASTLILLLIQPQGEVVIVSAVADAFQTMAQGLGWPWLANLSGIMMTLALVGTLGAWMTANSRIPFVIGLDRYLPKQLANLHPRFATPYVSILAQAVIVSVLFLLSLAGASVKGAYLLLLDMSVILYFIPFVYMFALLWIHRLRRTGESQAIMPLGKQRWTAGLIAFAGAAITIFSIVISCIPSKDVAHPKLFLLKLLGGGLLLLSLGLLSFWLYQKRRKE